MEPRHREEEVEQIHAEREREAHGEELDDEEGGDLAHRTPPDDDETEI